MITKYTVHYNSESEVFICESEVIIYASEVFFV